jgi:FixJ family two-component response regulator
MSGPELKSASTSLVQLPVIFFTATDVRTTVKAVKAGADDFLTKPVSSDDLLWRAIARHKEMRGQKSKFDVVRARIAALTPQGIFCCHSRNPHTSPRVRLY